MSKKKAGDHQDELEQVPEGAQPDAPKIEEPAKVKHHAPTVGALVHYWKRIPQNNGVQNLEPLPALISGLNPPGSYQKSDWAVAMWIFPNKPGAAPEAKHGVVYSETPTEGRWSYKK